MMSVLQQQLIGAIAGDLSDFLALNSASIEDLAEAAASVPRDQRTLRRGALLRVLKDLRRNTISSAEAQSWASFVKRGYISSRGGPVQAIEIPFESENELVDVLARLDELGDEIDGAISKEELSQMIEQMSA